MTALTITLAALLATSLLANLIQAAIYAGQQKTVHDLVRKCREFDIEAHRRNQHNLAAWKRRSLAAEKGMYAKCATSTPRTALK